MVAAVVHAHHAVHAHHRPGGAIRAALTQPPGGKREQRRVVHPVIHSLPPAVWRASRRAWRVHGVGAWGAWSAWRRSMRIRLRKDRR